MTSSTVLSSMLPMLILEAALLVKDAADARDPDTGPLFEAIRAFTEQYHASVLAKPVPATCTRSRFGTAIRAVEPGIFDLELLAGTLVAACSEVAAEGGIASADTAVRLIAYQIGLVCALNPDRRDGTELMFECTRRGFGR